MKKYLYCIMLAGWSFTLCCTASTPHKNLIGNGDFEDGGARWRGDENVVFETAKKNNNICKIKVDKKETFEFYQEIKSSKFKQITLKFRVKKSADYKGEGIQIKIDRCNGSASGSGRPLPRGNNWNEMEFSFGNSYLRGVPRIKLIFVVKPGTSGSISFDDITLTEHVENPEGIAPVRVDKGTDVSVDKSSAATEGYRIFTDKKGREIEAKIIRLTPDGQKVTVQRKKQKNTITVPLIVFDAETQSYIKCWSLGSDFMNDRIFSVETKRAKELITDRSRYGESEFSSTTVNNKYYGHRINFIFKNRSNQSFHNVSLEYTLYYNQELGTEFTRDGCLYKKQSITISPNSEQELRTEQIILQRLKSTTEGLFSGGSDREGKLEGVIIHLTLHLDNGEAVKKVITYPENLKRKWTTKTKNAQLSIPEKN